MYLGWCLLAGSVNRISNRWIPERWIRVAVVTASPPWQTPLYCDSVICIQWNWLLLINSTYVICFFPSNCPQSCSSSALYNHPCEILAVFFFKCDDFHHFFYKLKPNPKNINHSFTLLNLMRFTAVGKKYKLSIERSNCRKNIMYLEKGIAAY